MGTNEHHNIERMHKPERLKTLKDLEGDIGSAEYFHHKDKEPTKDYDEVAIVKELREEAIKWIKEMNIKDANYVYYCVSWIKLFFNITAEDLK